MITPDVFGGAQRTPVELTDDDELLERFGHRQRFVRTLESFDSFAIPFSFISITTGIFTTFGFLLTNAGPRGIWTWPLVIAGQTLVAMVYAALVAKIPVAGYSYQWASQLASPTVGWWFGWLSFSFLSIVTVSVDYAFVQVAFQPLFGMEYTPTSAAFWTIVVIVVQCVLIIASTRITTRVNNFAVLTEIFGVLQLTIVVLVATQVARRGSWSNLWSTGIVPEAGWYSWLGPVMLATLLGGYTIVGFESAANLAEETIHPRRVVPKATVRSVLASGALGMAFLIIVAQAIPPDEIPEVSASSSPVATILKDFFGGVVVMPLAWMCISIFACGMIIMTTNSRLIWAMARDRLLPGHSLLAQVHRPTGGPTWSTILAAAISGGIVLLLRTNADALFTLFTAATLMPASLYAGTVLLYVFTRHRVATEPGLYSLGNRERAVVVGALVWLAYELIVLLAPAQFRPAQRYALGALALGLVVFLLMQFLEPAAMRGRRPPRGRQPLSEPPLVGARAERRQPAATEAHQPSPSQRPAGDGASLPRRTRTQPEPGEEAAPPHPGRISRSPQ